MEEGKTCYIVNCGDITPTKQPMGEEENHGASAHNVGGGTGQVGYVERKLVQRIKMDELQQKPGVNVPQYLDALRGQARQCQYEVKTLLEMVEFFASQEQASLERSQVGVERDNASATKQSTTSQKRCSYCQGESHGANTRLVRREKCPAWDIQCAKCQIRGHFGKVCFKCSACGQWGHKSKYSKLMKTSSSQMKRRLLYSQR